ncbi:hypothetical protein PHYPSEUDO_014479 [Phytophthora pseudosyringae]|uniref:Extradiol ring-cleavage dioxygenase class III enzyme subunit B domain-containing protein n=1 Tax=Phytophthora pseudosyringae TaxID=221518 RepID=A0A8T1W546_9STRA|nr:hypothetical protein PHYPSEUDO_014479 [Phytophthora pseudosyringae]
MKSINVCSIANPAKHYYVNVYGCLPPCGGAADPGGASCRARSSLISQFASTATSPHLPPTMSAFRHPVVAVSHGPGPLWLLSSAPEDIMKDARPAALLLASLLEKLYPKDENLPKRILFVSAHFESESSSFEISSAADPDMIYDYYGFPDEAYEFVYPAKGDPAFAQRVKEQLEKNNIKAKLVNRGYDHGVFVPMKLIRPQADIPIVTMSINSNLSNQDHLNLGKALASFRDEDTLILCSGQSTHNLRGIHSRSPSITEGSRAFQYWLDTTLAADSKLSADERTRQIIDWRDAPGAKFAHPSPDHFMTFVVAAGAGMDEKEPAAKAFFGGWALGQMSFANYAWGVQQ